MKRNRPSLAARLRSAGMVLTIAFRNLVRQFRRNLLLGVGHRRRHGHPGGHHLLHRRPHRHPLQQGAGLHDRAHHPDAERVHHAARRRDPRPAALRAPGAGAGGRDRAHRRDGQRLRPLDRQGEDRAGRAGGHPAGLGLLRRDAARGGQPAGPLQAGRLPGDHPVQQRGGRHRRRDERHRHGPLRDGLRTGPGAEVQGGGAHPLREHVHGRGRLRGHRGPARDAEPEARGVPGAEHRGLLPPGRAEGDPRRRTSCTRRWPPRSPG